MILSLLLAAQIGGQVGANAVPPEVRAVQDRARREAAEKRGGEGTAAADGAVAAQTADGPLPIPPAYAAKFKQCIDAVNADANKGLEFAAEWVVTGGSFYARQCQGYGLARSSRWVAAEVAFAQAANLAEITKDKDAARLWAQAGNAALAGKDFAKARSDFDAAIAHGLPNGVHKGEAYLDRARAHVGLRDMPAARADLNRAIEQVPADPLAWLLSATLARQTDELALAEKHIAEAARLAPDDAAVALEEGNIAVMARKDEAAKAAWGRAVKLGGDGEAGKAAAANLAELAKVAGVGTVATP